MCGIFCHIYRSNTGVNCQDHDCKLLASLSPLLSSRGPDHSGEILLNASGDLALHFYSSVLWLRGDVMQPQPATTKDDGHVLCWNGDVFGGDLDGEDDESDTSALFKRLKALPDDANVPAVMCSVEGPHAFVYYRAETNRIWFGRDYIGRHSLLMSANGDKDQFVLTSVTDPTALPCVEVPACGVYEGRLDQLGRPGWITLHKWHQDQKLPQSLDHKFIPHEKWLKTNRTIFSNGQNIREDEWVEKAILEEWPAAKIMKQFQDCHGHLVRQLEFVLKESVRKRVTRQPNRCKGCISDKKEFDGGKNCSHAKVGVLFSGGIDSVVVTALADQILPPDEQIDLINVAFAKSSEIGESGSYDGVPDRLTAVQAIKELRKLNPERKYNFVAVNVPKEELAEERINRVAKLLHPHDTVLDDSIGCALWFAARGMGSDGYASPVRVLLLGMGADEQLGGYARHRARFNGGDWTALTDEIRMEVERIAERNLGRDNRIVADRGVAPRFPYLDEDVVSFLSSVPTFVKADLRLRRGIGEKLLLRCLAWNLGLYLTATEPKRAIQFGSRIAKLENAKEKGGEKAKRTN